MNRSLWWALLAVMSGGMLALDIVTSPAIHFPITFVVPVGLAAWHLGRKTGIGFAVALVLGRMVIALGMESATTPAWAAAVNAVIRLVVLVAMAVVAGMLQHRRELAVRVQVLEGILPICSFCKKIRRDDGSWEQIEMYVTKHSEAHFSHGLCEACLEQHYPESADDHGPPARPNG